jgi:hypothetical protein
LGLALAPMKVWAQECPPEPLWQVGQLPVELGVEQRGAVVEVAYEQPFTSLSMSWAGINWHYATEMIRQDERGFVMRITRPAEYAQAQTIYLDYVAFGYAAGKCEAGEVETGDYRVMIPLVVK